MQAFQQQSSSYAHPASTNSQPGPPPSSYPGPSCCQHQPSGSTCSCCTPPEYTYSSSSSSGASSSTSPFGAFDISSSTQVDFLYPPHSQLSTVPFSSTTTTSSTSGKRTAPVQPQQSLQQQHQHQHHLPKSLSRSSISSDGSTLLFSPTQDPQQLHRYSPVTPPLPLPMEASNNTTSRQSLPPQSQSVAPVLASISTAKPSNKLPLLPDLIGDANIKVDGMATTIPAVMQPGCISQLATYLAEMIVYLWFSPPLKRAPIFPRPTGAFARFCNDILTTTQVSQSVVVLALYFVSKLQAKHSIEPRAGSEYKLTIASLMLANKILDDHTYTNKTWSEVSGLPLDVLNGAEVEFLQGLDFDLHVSHTAYKAWYIMLQNGESSNIVKQSHPPRKKAKVVNPIAPSAPTSPMHYTSSSSTAATAVSGFDFTFTMPASATVPSNPFALQVPTSRHSVNAWPMPAAQMPESAYMHPTFSQNAVSTAAPSSSQGTSRKRRASDAALTPGQSSAGPAHQALQPALQVNTNDLLRSHPGTLNGIPSHLYTPIVSTPTSAMSVVSASRATTPRSTHGPGVQQGYYVQDFMPNDLTSSWSPVDELGNRRPQDLTYYALAAGQQRGGYLTHQPLPPYPMYPVYYPGMPMHHPQTGRAFAPLPRNVSSSASGGTSSMTPVMQQAGVPQRTSLSLSPVDMRSLYAQSQEGQMYPQNANLHPSMLQQPMWSKPMQGQSRLTPPAMAPPQHYHLNDQRSYSASLQGMPHVQPQVPLPSPLEPSLQSLVLSSGVSQSPSATPTASRQQQPVPPPQSYYSTFANNGLPGVLSWPAQALAKYQNVVQPHQQPWLRDFA